MQYTENYEMKKPETSDFYDVEDFNENADIVDSKLKELETAKDNMNQAMAELKKYVSDGKTAIASAITELGVATQTDAAFQEMVQNINNLEISMRRVKHQIFADLNGHNEQELDMQEATIEDPILSWSGSKITATTKISQEGFADAGTSVSASASIATQAEKTITPGTSVQTVETSGNRVYFSGDMKVDSLGGDANKGDVLVGKTFSSDTSGRAVSGTMPNNGAVSKALNCGGSYTIPAGYHNGSGKVTANGLSGQTDGTASAENILSGKTAWVNGQKVSGSMADNGAQAKNLNCGEEYTIPEGYHNGTGKVSANSLSSQTEGTASAGNILSGKTAWANGKKMTGSMSDNGTQTKSLNCGEGYTIPAGYHNGAGKVTANSLSSQTQATASASEIVTGKTAWVNGSKVTGTMNRLADYRYIPNQTLQIRDRTSYSDGTGATKNCSSTKFLSVYEGCTGYISGTNHEHMILLSRLGNATAHQVVRGATFTSGNCNSVATEGTFDVTTVSHVYSWGNHNFIPLYMRIGALDYNGHDATAFTQTALSGSVSMSQGTGYMDVTVSSGYGCYVIKNGITLSAGTYTLAMRSVEYSGSGNHYVFLSTASNAASPAASMHMINYGACAGDKAFHNYTTTIAVNTTQVLYPVVYCTSAQKFSLCGLSIWRHL